MRVVFVHFVSMGNIAGQRNGCEPSEKFKTAAILFNFSNERGEWMRSTVYEWWRTVFPKRRVSCTDATRVPQVDLAAATAATAATALQESFTLVGGHQ